MRGLRLPEHEEPWVEAEPGVSCLQLDDHLRIRGCGLAVYPTSARRATVGGWLTQDDLGVGSFEYGWVSENVLSANLVLPGGERWEVPGKAQIRRHREGESPFEVAVDGYTEAGGFGLPKLTKKPEQPGSWKACMACGARWMR
jgi:FAD/FMN-containing dehydrogenase